MSTPPKNSATDTPTPLSEIREALRALTERVAAIVEPDPPVRVARGTRDLDPALLVAARAAALTMEPAPVDLRGRAEAALRAESLDLARLGKVLDVDRRALEALLRELSLEGRIYNVGGGERPQYTWKVGDEVDTRTLRGLVERLVSERPLTTSEIVAATGVKMSRINGVMVEIQRAARGAAAPYRILNLGEGHVYRWLLIGPRAKDASLPPKRTRAERARGPAGGKDD